MRVFVFVFFARFSLPSSLSPCLYVSLFLYVNVWISSRIAVFSGCLCVWLSGCLAVSLSGLFLPFLSMFEERKESEEGEGSTDWGGKKGRERPARHTVSKTAIEKRDTKCHVQQKEVSTGERSSKRRSEENAKLRNTLSYKDAQEGGGARVVCHLLSRQRPI